MAALADAVARFVAFSLYYEENAALRGEIARARHPELPRRLAAAAHAVASSA